MQLFYNPSIKETENLFVFDKEESKHIIKVLRKKESDILYVTNGLGFLFKTKITLASDSKCCVEILSFNKQEPSKYHLHLAVAPTKMNERYEWFLEKATEIGVQEITPILCEHSERKIIKIDRFQKIIESAMKQSLHNYIPIINEPITFKDFLKKTHKGQKFIAHCEETNKKSLKEELQPNQDAIILIGPEGDFSTKEIQLALDNTFIPVSLGNTRLRTETAAIVACHSVSFANE
ncbi:16S rRNA (uracil(1498)-N(3))-methyltransferase [Flavobacterium sp.]|uniref:16S rRNA (uracil(1498)-N(3))-methyltransferase n=1 Tax=Flavobacterium sp. TaxID=239 RepID=UPI0037520DCF